jgi:hypothetical protein
VEGMLHKERGGEYGAHRDTINAALAEIEQEGFRQESRVSAKN